MLKNISNLATMACQDSLRTSITEFVKNGKKILGAGLNYKELVKLQNKPLPKVPIFFLKPTTSYIVEGEDIVIPPGFVVNEEIELGVIISKRGFNIPECQAMDYVGGFCVALDMTSTSELGVARTEGLPWTIGKGFDTACPVSGFINKNAIPDPSNVSLWLKINGEMKQKGNTNDMIFSVPKLISYISQFMTLEPSDLIVTGSPPGMGPVKSGDVLEGGIDGGVTIKFKVK